jgi:hypothetical protein
MGALKKGRHSQPAGSSMPTAETRWHAKWAAAHLAFDLPLGCLQLSLIGARHASLTPHCSRIRRGAPGRGGGGDMGVAGREARRRLGGRHRHPTEAAAAAVPEASDAARATSGSPSMLPCLVL